MFEYFIGNVDVQAEFAHGEAHFQSTSVTAKSKVFVDRGDFVLDPLHDLVMDSLNVEIGVVDKAALSTFRATDFERSAPEAVTLRK